jgi:ZIP family zinc transporter
VEHAAEVFESKDAATVAALSRSNSGGVPAAGPDDPEATRLMEVELSSSSTDAHPVRPLLANEHKDHIKGHIDELTASIEQLDERAARLAAPGTLAHEEEALAEEIDEELHKLMYKLDHARRLLEGAESGAPQPLPEGDKAALRARVGGLKAAMTHLQEHMAAPSLDAATVLEVHQHMNDLDAMLHMFHKKSDDSFSRWRRRTTGDVEAAARTGAPLPWSLIGPVTVDALVDGFLIGLSCALSAHAGLVLAGATCIEMAFLGAAFAATVSRCTGASPLSRLAAVALPPATLVLAAAAGGALGDVSSSHPALFVAFVAFGVVELLFLVTHELLIEAHEALNGDHVWWINLWLFIGIFVVLLVNRALPD